MPRRSVRTALIQAIHYRSPEAAAKLSATFASHTPRNRAAIAVAPPVAAPAKTDPLAFELAITAMADELDLAPRRVRASLTALLARIAQAGFSLEAARRELALRASAT